MRRAGSAATERESIDWTRQRLAHFNCPKSVDFVDALPRNPSGRQKMRILRQPCRQGQDRSLQ